MDKTTLVKEQIDGGARLVRRLREGGVEVNGALWARTGSDSKDYLYLITPEVENRDTNAAYGRVGDALKSLIDDNIPWEEQIYPFAVKLIPPSHRLARGVLDHFARIPDAHPTWHHDTTLGSAYIENAYIYPATLFAPLPAAAS